MIGSLALACAANGPATPAPAAPAPTTPTTQQETGVTETITETTVGDLDGVRVPMAQVTTDDYTLPDGTTAHGLVCVLVLPEGPTWVGTGSRVVVEGRTWEVASLVAPDGELGEITLTRLD